MLAVGDSAVGTPAETAAHFAFKDFIGIVERNPSWPGSRVMHLYGEAVTVGGHVRVELRDGRAETFKFVIRLDMQTIQFLEPWPLGPYTTGEQAALAEQFRLLAVAFDKNLWPRIVFSRSGGKSIASLRDGE